MHDRIYIGLAQTLANDNSPFAAIYVLCTLTYTKHPLMALIKFTGLKRSITGTFLYCLAIFIKFIAIVTSYWLLSGNDWFLSWTGMEMDLYEHGIGTIYWGSLLMSLQAGILLYSLTHDYYMAGKPGKRQLLKASVFLWSPVQALLVWFRDHGYWMMSWEYGLMVFLDVLVLIGCVSRGGGSVANRLRPFKERKHHHHKRHHHASGQGLHHSKLAKNQPRRHHSASPSDSDSDSDSSSSSDSYFSDSDDVEMGRRHQQVIVCKCDCQRNVGQGRTTASFSSSSPPVTTPSVQSPQNEVRPKIRVDGH
jgi:hypothetical protein